MQGKGAPRFSGSGLFTCFCFGGTHSTCKKGVVQIPDPIPGSGHVAPIEGKRKGRRHTPAVWRHMLRQTHVSHGQNSWPIGSLGHGSLTIGVIFTAVDGRNPFRTI